MMRLRPADTDAHFATARVLFEEYAEDIGVDLCFQGFADELENLPTMYGPPSGVLWLAEIDGVALGCVGLRATGTPGVCEMKRLYVHPKARGTGLGRRLAETIIAEGRRLGYRSMRLDTLPSMQHAQALYRTLGFREIPPYYDNPEPGVLYMACDLTAPDPQPGLRREDLPLQ